MTSKSLRSSTLTDGEISVDAGRTTTAGRADPGRFLLTSTPAGADILSGRFDRNTIMPGHRPRGFLHESALTRYATALSVVAIAATALFLIRRYPSLPDILPVHFRTNGRPNGWQFRTIPRVFIPVFVQLGIFVAGTSVGALLLSRKDAAAERVTPDMRAAMVATEAVVVMSTIWVVVQSYTAYSLVRLWSGVGSNLGRGYTALEIGAVIATAVVGVRAQRRLAQPEPLPYIPAHWRLGQLYCNADDPALFVPARDGRRWTLNFGRPAAVILLGGILVVGVVAPTVMLAVTLR